VMTTRKNDTYSPKQHEEPWLGNPDDHEPTKKVKQEDVNP